MKKNENKEIRYIFSYRARHKQLMFLVQNGRKDSVLGRFHYRISDTYLQTKVMKNVQKGINCHFF